MDCGMSAFAEVGMKEVAINANQFYSGNIWVPRTLSPMLNSDGKPPEMNHQATIGWTWNYHEYLCWVINPSVIVTTSIFNWNSTSMNQTFWGSQQFLISLPSDLYLNSHFSQMFPEFAKKGLLQWLTFLFYWSTPSGQNLVFKPTGLTNSYSATFRDQSQGINPKEQRV